MWSRTLHSRFIKKCSAICAPIYPFVIQCCSAVGLSSTTKESNRLTSLYNRLFVKLPQERMKVAEFTKQKVLMKTHTKRGLRSIKIFPPPLMITSQSMVLPGDIRACSATPYPHNPIEYPDPNTRTMYDALQSGLQKTSSGRCLGTRSLESGKYEWLSYKEVDHRKTLIGSGLIRLGLDPSQKTAVGVCTKTRTEFVLTMLGCSCYSMVLVPMYNVFGADILSNIINEVEMEAVICETTKMAEDLIERADTLPTLKHIIIIENDVDEIVNLKDSKFNILSFKDLEMLGKDNIVAPIPPQTDDLFCIMYTSGTTGQPKGALITHKNLVSTVSALEYVLEGAVPTESTLICYLPCAHIYEIVNEVSCLYRGGELGFYSGNTEKLLDDIAALRPTTLPLVPKLMNLIYDGVKKKIGPNAVKRWLFQAALRQKEYDLKRGIVTKSSLLDRLILSKIQNVLGGRVEFIFASSAPVSKEVMRFFRCSMGCLVFEVYGLSEVGAATMTLMSEHDSGFVGPPLPHNHMKLVDVPEMKYFAKNNFGEICIRGSNVFSGYFKNKTATEEALDKDGWYHTGDIGTWLENGTLRIIDRKKHIFKLGQGEYIVPDFSENIYVQSHILLQVFLDGVTDKDFAVAIVVPDEIAFIEWAQKMGFKGMGLATLCQNKDVKKAVLAHMMKVGKKKGLTSLHQAGNIHLSTEQFTQENGLLTPTMKLKRSVARKRFEPIFLKLYEEGNLRKQLNL